MLEQSDGSPVRHDPNTNGHLLQLIEGHTVVIFYCPHCGSDGDRENCICGQPERWCRLPNSCVLFDPALNEYSLAFREVMVPFRYCPNCGGRLPQSLRSINVKRRSAAEMARLVNLLKGVQTLDDVVQRLGPPDREPYPSAGTPRLLPDESPEVKRSALFTQTASTVRVIAQELANGEVRIIFASQPSD